MAIYNTYTSIENPDVGYDSISAGSITADKLWAYALTSLTAVVITNINVTGSTSFATLSANAFTANTAYINATTGASLSTTNANFDALTARSISSTTLTSSSISSLTLSAGTVKNTTLYSTNNFVSSLSATSITSTSISANSITAANTLSANVTYLGTVTSQSIYSPSSISANTVSAGTVKFTNSYITNEFLNSLTSNAITANSISAISLTTISNTILARDSGFVGIGTITALKNSDGTDSSHGFEIRNRGLVVTEDNLGSTKNSYEKIYIAAVTPLGGDNAMEFRGVTTATNTANIDFSALYIISSLEPGSSISSGGTINAAKLYAYHIVTGFTSYVKGAVFHPDIWDGTVSSMIGAESIHINRGKTVTAMIGFKAGVPVTWGTQQYTYGFYVEPTAAGSIANYGFYQPGNQRNYFGGFIGQGLTAPLVNIHTTGSISASSITAIGSISSNTLSTGIGRVTTEYVVNSFNTSLTSNALTANSISADSISARLTLSSETTYTGPLTSQSIYSPTSISANTLSAGTSRFTTEYTNAGYFDTLSANSITGVTISGTNLRVTSISATNANITSITADSLVYVSVTSLEIVTTGALNIAGSLDVTGSLLHTYIAKFNNSSSAIRFQIAEPSGDITATGNLTLLGSISAVSMTANTTLSGNVTLLGTTTAQSIYSPTSISSNTLSTGIERVTTEYVLNSFNTSLTSNALTSNSISSDSITARLTLSSGTTYTGPLTSQSVYSPTSISANTLSAGVARFTTEYTVDSFNTSLTANTLTANSISAWNLTANNNVYLSRLSGSTIVGGNDNTPLEKFRIIQGNVLVDATSGLMSYNTAGTNRGQIVGVSASNDVVIGDISNIFTSKDLILYAGGNRYFWVKNDGKIGINTSNPAAQLDVAGTISAQNNVTLADAKQISTPTFTSGIFGDGFRLDSNNTIPQQSFLEIDNLRVRGTLRAHVFQKDIVRASNGYLLITDATVLVNGISSSDTSITAKEQVFQPADIVWIKDIQDSTSAGGAGGLSINSEFMKINNNGTQVTSASGIVYAVTRAYGAGFAQNFAGNSTLVRIGTTGAQYGGRTGVILLDSSSEASPFIDIVDGLTSTQNSELLRNASMDTTQDAYTYRFTASSDVTTFRSGTASIRYTATLTSGAVGIYAIRSGNITALSAGKSFYTSIWVKNDTLSGSNVSLRKGDSTVVFDPYLTNTETVDNWKHWEATISIPSTATITSTDYCIFVKCYNNDNSQTGSGWGFWCDDASIKEVSTASANPFIQTSTSGSKIKVRLGQLRGITSPTWGALPDTYGLWGKNIYLEGNIAATAGYIGTSTQGWGINSTSITSTNVSIAANSGSAYIGLGSNVTSYNKVGVFIGLSGASLVPVLSLSSGPLNFFDWDGTKLTFRANNVTLDENGNLNLSGSVTAYTGQIGGWYIGTNTLSAGSGASHVELKPGTGIWSGADAIASAPFVVTNAGNVTATNAMIRGSISASTITAYSGYIGNGATQGWTIDSTKISNAGITADSNNKAYYINSSVFGNDGIQLEYNAANPRAYVGNGTNQGIKFDGSVLTISGTNLNLDSSGNLVLSGSISSLSGNIGGWKIGTQGLSSSTDNMILDSSVPAFKILNVLTAQPNNLTVSGTISAQQGALGNLNVYGTITAGSTNKILINSDGLTAYKSAVKNLIFNNNTGELTISGTVTAESGKIGGWQLNPTTLVGGAITLNSAGSISSTKFLLKTDGTITATDAILSGSLSAFQGQIGNWQIAQNKLSSSNMTIDSSTGINFNNKFLVDQNGNLTALNTYLSGGLTATLGSLIAGWSISSDRLYSDNLQLQLISSGSNSGLIVQNTLTARNNLLSVSGTISSNLGDIGGWKLASQGLSSSNNTFILDPSIPAIKVANVLTAQPNSLTVSGTISAQAGDIAGWKIYSQIISSSGVYSSINLNSLTGEISITGNKFGVEVGNANYVTLLAPTLKYTTGLDWGYTKYLDFSVYNTQNYSAGNFKTIIDATRTFNETYDQSGYGWSVSSISGFRISVSAFDSTSSHVIAHLGLQNLTGATTAFVQAVLPNRFKFIQNEQTQIVLYLYNSSEKLKISGTAYGNGTYVQDLGTVEPAAGSAAPDPPDLLWPLAQSAILSDDNVSGNKGITGYIDEIRSSFVHPVTVFGIRERLSTTALSNYNNYYTFSGPNYIETDSTNAICFSQIRNKSDQSQTTIQTFKVYTPGNGFYTQINTARLSSNQLIIDSINANKNIRTRTFNSDILNSSSGYFDFIKTNVQQTVENQTVTGDFIINQNLYVSQNAYIGNALTANSISSSTLSAGTARVTNEYVANSFNTSLTANSITSNSISSDSITARLILSSGTTYTGPLTSQSIYSPTSISSSTISAETAKFTNLYTTNEYFGSLTADSFTGSTISALTGYFERVGIGTATPDARLNIANVPANEVALKIGRASGQPSIKSTSDWLIMDSNTYPAALNYWSDKNVILARGGGKVAIGHDTPFAKLDVFGSFIVSGDNARIGLQRESGANYLEFSPNGGLIIRSICANDTNAVNLFKIDTSGRLGVWTMSPLASIHTTGSISASSITAVESISSNTLSTGTEKVTTEYVVNSFNTSLTSNSITANSISADSVSARLTLSSGTTYTGPLTSQSIYSPSSISSSTLSAGTIRSTKLGVNIDPQYDLHVNGVIFASELASSGGKHFIIPHPTKSEKKLVHTAVETNANDLYYRGIAMTQNYEAVVNLPEYFNKLITEKTISVYLTPIKQYANIYLYSIDYEHNKFIVKIKRKNWFFEIFKKTPKSILFSYIIFGERKDIEKLKEER